ncbi:O-antigen ligase family protein [bacterium]|nr:O-antigen ligase family protein [bacterium]
MVRGKLFNKIAYGALLGLCVSIAFSIVAVEFFVGLLFILWLAKLFIDDKTVIHHSKVSAILIIFVTLRILSSLFSLDINNSLNSLGKLPLLLVFFPINTLFSRKDLEKALGVMIIAIALASLLGSAKVIFFGMDRARTTYGGYTGLSLQITVAINLSLYFILKTKHALKLYLPFFIILFIGLLATYARTQWITAFLSIIVAIALIRPKRLFYIISGMICGLLSVPESIMQRLLETFRYGGDSSRIALWDGSLDLLKGLPFFGYGPKTFLDIFPKSALKELLDQSVWNYHNDFIQVAIESGWLTLAVFIILWCVILILVCRAACLRDSMKILCGTAFLGLFVSSLLNGVFFDPMVMPIIALLFVVLGRSEEINLKKGDKLLLVRLDKIGDVVLTTPMAGALKKRFPGVIIDMAVRPGISLVASMSAHVDKVVEAPGSVLKFSKIIKMNKYKMAVLVHPDIWAAVAISLARVRIRIGSEYRLWAPLLLTHRVLRHRDPRRHESVLNAELLEFLGIDSNDLPSPELNTIDSAFSFEPEKPIIGFHPGSGGSVLRCQPRIFGEAARLLKESGFSIVVTGGTDDEKSVEEFLCASGLVDYDFAGKTNISELGKIISKCQVFVAQGTGPLHIASGLGIPVVGVYPPSLKTGVKRWHPLGSKYIAVKPKLSECKRCIGEKCSHFNCLESICPEEIVRAVKELSVVKSSINGNKK